MAWALSKNPFSELSIQQTNILQGPIGAGVPVSGKEYNVNFLLRAQAEQDIYRSISPSGCISRLLQPTQLETSTTVDSEGELTALTTSGLAIANTIRLGLHNAVVNGWRIPVSNADGTGGLHNNIVLDSAPSTGTRYDLVFLEVWLAELGGTSATISNTANKPSATTIWRFGNTQYRGANVTDDISEVDAEINRRWQIQYRLRVVDGVSIDTFPDGVDDTINVKAWGANPNSTWTGFTAGVGSPYTFQNASASSDPGLYVSGDGSTTARSVLGTVDGYTYAIPVCVISRRNQGIYDPASNPFGSAAVGPTGGNIASAISGRPDGLFYDQIISTDILSLRHQIFTDASTTYDSLASDAFHRVLRNSLVSRYSVGDGSGAPTVTRSTNPLYAQEITTVANLDAGFKGFAEYNFQRRIFSDAAVIQQTQITFEGGTAPDNALPTTLAAPAQATGSSATGTGSLAAATYFAKVTYTNGFGESLPSAESTGIVLGGTGEITINSPIVSGNASGYNVYISVSSGTETKQNSIPISIGTNYVQSSALISGASQPGANTTSSTLVIAASSNGITNGSVTVKCIDGTTTPSTGNLPGSVNILVYDVKTNAAVPGSWSGLGTATATFTPSSPWSSNDTSFGVVVIVGLSYPAGNGMTLVSSGVVAQKALQGASATNMQVVGVSGVSGADDAHFNIPRGIYVDTSGFVYVVDQGNHRVIKYNSNFVKQSQFGITGVAGADNTHLNLPSDVIVDNSGNVYVTDTQNHRIVKLNASMAYAAQFGVTNVTGSDTSHLNQPRGLDFDASQNNIYIADTVNNRIVRITNAMVYGASPITSLTYPPFGLTVGAAGGFPVIYLTQNGKQIVKYTTTDGITFTSSLTFGNPTVAGSDAFHLGAVIGLRLDAAGYLYCCDYVNDRIIKLNSNFIYVGQLGVTGKFGTDLGHLNGAKNLDFDANGLLYVVDTNNQRVLRMHPEMGMCDPTLRQFEILYSGAGTDRLQIWYNYVPYQGLIGNQGNVLMNYTFRALTDMKAVITTCGTGGRNSHVEDGINGLLTRLPLPLAAFGTSPTIGQTEWAQTGIDINFADSDSSGLLANGPVAYGGGMTIFGPSDPLGNQAGPSLANSLVRISQTTLTAGYPFRGVNTIQRYVENLSLNAGWDALGLSFGVINSSFIDHITAGYFLAVASGGSSTMPLIPGEVVLVVASFRVVGLSAAIYGQTNQALAVDVFRLPGRPLVRY